VITEERVAIFDRILRCSESIVGKHPRLRIAIKEDRGVQVPLWLEYLEANGFSVARSRTFLLESDDKEWLGTISLPTIKNPIIEVVVDSDRPRAWARGYGKCIRLRLDGKGHTDFEESGSSLRLIHNGNVTVMARYPESHVISRSETLSRIEENDAVLGWGDRGVLLGKFSSEPIVSEIKDFLMRSFRFAVIMVGPPQ
jgi:hypothetical protein